MSQDTPGHSEGTPGRASKQPALSVWESLPPIPTAISIFALLVSVYSVVISKKQELIASEQLVLRQLEARPYVKFMPHFFEEDEKINIYITIEDLNAVPAQVLYHRSTAAFDKEISGVFIQSRSYSRDILYQHKGAGAEFPPIKAPLKEKLASGNLVLRLATCLIYSTISEKDSRRWEIDSVYEYQPGSEDPITLFTTEKSILNNDAEPKCDASPIFKNWIERH